MLPWPDSIGIAQSDAVAVAIGAPEVGNQPVSRPVPAADDIARTRTGDGNVAGGEETVRIAASEDFRRRLGS